MGNNFQFVYNTPVATGTASTSHSSYPATNLTVYERTRMHWRSTVSTASWAQAAFSSATVRGVIFNDVNFTACTVTASGGAVAKTTALDERVGRRKLIAVLDDVCAAIRIDISSQTPTDGIGVFRIGSIIPFTSRMEVIINPSHPYAYSADEPNATNDFESGGFSDRALGPRIWEGSFGFDYHPRTSESEIWTFNSILKSGNMGFYENMGDVGKCYFCRRREPVKVSWIGYDYNRIESIKLKELY